MKSIKIILLLIFCTSTASSQVNEQPKDIVYKYFDSVVRKNKLHTNFIESFERYAESIGEIKNFDSISNLYYKLACTDSSKYFQFSRYYLAKVVKKLNLGKIGEAEYYNELYYDMAIKMNSKHDQIIALRRIIGLANFLSDSVTFNKYVPLVIPELESFEKTITAPDFNYKNIISYIYFLHYIGSHYAGINDSINVKKTYNIVKNIKAYIDTSTFVRESEKNFFNRTVLLTKMLYKAFYPTEIYENFYQKIDNYYLDPDAHLYKPENYDATRIYLFLAIKLEDPNLLRNALKLFNKYVYDHNLFNNESLKLKLDGILAFLEKDYKNAADNLIIFSERNETENTQKKLENVKKEKENYINKLNKELAFSNELKAIQEKAHSQMIMIGVIFLTVIFIIVISYKYYSKTKKMEKDRIFLSQSVHDEIAPLTLFVRQSLQSYHRKNFVSPEAFDDLEKQISDVTDMVRKISHEINDNKRYFTANLLTTFNALKDIIVKFSGKDVHLSFDVPNMAISFSQFHRIKLMVSELITNTIKHSEYSEIFILINYKYHEISILYKDDGIGFDIISEDNDGLGMKSLHFHTQILNGTIELENNFPKGYFYKITIPLT